MIRTLQAKLALALAWLVTVTVVLVAPAPPARAQATLPQLTVEFTGLRTTGSQDNQSVVLTGKVTNTSVQPAFGVRAVLWRSRDPITEADAFRTVLNGENSPWGVMLNRTTDHYFSVTASDQSFDPGASAEFTVKATLADLGFTSSGAVYLMGVQVRGTGDASSNYQTLGKGRTFYVTAPEKRLPLTSLALLAATPTKVRPNVFVSERLVGELTGRLDTLLQAAGRPGSSWLVDPALIDEVTDMADGYEVLDGADGQTRPGTGQAAAQAWLQRFRSLPNDRGARTLFGNPDVLGAEQNNATDVIGRASDALTNDELKRLALVVLPHAGIASPTTPAFVASADPDALLVSNGGRGTVVATGSSAATVVRLAPAATAAGPGDADGAVQRQQRQYAEAIFGHGLVRLLRTADDVAADTAPGWLRRTGVDDLLERTPSGTATLTLPAKTTALPQARFKQLHAMAHDFSLYRDLVPDTAFATDAAGTLSRMGSSWWIGNQSAAPWINAVNETIGQPEVQAHVTLSASPRVLMSSRANEFPVTVSNRLAEPIQVRVVFTSDNPQRLTVPASAVITVGPGQNQTVNVRPEATSNGLVNVTAGLQTGSGTPIGRTTRIAVEVTDLGMIGWIIVIVSGVVLVAATALRIRQVRRKQKEDQA